VSPPSPSSVLANGPDSFIWWSWIGDHGDEIWTRTREHVQLTVIAVAVGFAISVVLSLIAVRYRWTYAPITWIGSVLYTIPSLALFGFLIPFTGLGLLTAEIALVSYTILILVRNIVAGIDGVPRAVREAADGMGYTSRRRLWTVELPLALPTIIAGLRIASVTFIDDGLSRNFSTPIVLGAVLSVALALLVDIAFAALLWFLTPWRRRAAARTT
jgi:osmoprotectant transport system permease protein